MQPCFSYSTLSTPPSLRSYRPFLEVISITSYIDSCKHANCSSHGNYLFYLDYEKMTAKSIQWSFQKKFTLINTFPFSFFTILFWHFLRFFNLLQLINTPSRRPRTWDTSNRVTTVAFYPDGASSSLINKPAVLTRSFLQPWVTSLGTNVFFIINKPTEFTATSVDVSVYLSLRNCWYSYVFIFIRISCVSRQIISE